MDEKFDTVKRGYDPGQVDEYIDKLEEVIRGYKDKETSIINAVLNAQSISDSIIKNAEARARQIEINSRRGQEEILATLEDQIKSLRLFQDEYSALVTKYFNPFDSSEIARLLSKMNRLWDCVKGIGETGTTGGKPL